MKLSEMKPKSEPLKTPKPQVKTIIKKVEYVTPQTLISEVLNQLRKEKESLTPEQDKLLNILANEHRNYSFARANITRFIDFCLQKGLIKKVN